MQESQYDVSIIVPVYNREKLIIPCIKSINAQTYDKAKWEVIFVDDGSTDKSVETIESLIDKKINYRIIKREIPSGNASAPRNEGIKASRAKYVFFLDSDDYIDEQLLENGCKIAFKNDSDIVYFKIKGINGRNGGGVATRPFKKPYVEKADIYNEHLLRSLAPMKMFKVKILRDNDILFNPCFIKREDQIFTATAIINSHTVSILADKDYYGLVKHEGEHLNIKRGNLFVLGQVYIDILWHLYCSDRDLDFKRKIYNALLIRVVETSRNLKLDKNVLSYFTTIVSIFNIHKELFDLSQIYENEKTLTLCFLSGDFESFYKMPHGDNDLKEPLKSLFLDLTKEFKKYNGCQKVWVYNGKIIVIDFVFKDNKIAFDLEYDKTKKELKIWMFCRNNKSFFESSKFKPLEIDQHKLCIFRGDTDKTEIIKNIAKYWEIIFTKGYNV